MSEEFEFDVLLSFASPERDYARAIHAIATANGLKVFFDEEFQHEVWGRNLVEYLDHTYRARGRYVVVLVSQAYVEKSYPKVERRAALDRMIEQAAEYLLPVRVDEAWIPGLPRSTAYVDLRTAGVIGVCELLVRKLKGGTGALILPEGLNIPRVPQGTIPASQLADHLVALCQRPQVTLFGTLIYDETNVAVRRLLTRRDYWNALDTASGQHLEVFAVRDEEQYGCDVDFNAKMLTASTIPSTKDRGYYFSSLMKDYFGVDKRRINYPSFALFFVEAGKVRRCWRIPFHQASVEDTLNWLIKLFRLIDDGIASAGGPNAALGDILAKVKRLLLAAHFTLYIQSPPSDAEHAIRQLTDYVETAGVSD